MIFCLAWALESQLLRITDVGRKGFKKEVVMPIVLKFVPDYHDTRDFDLDVENILNHEITVNSNGHFALTTIEDLSSVHNYLTTVCWLVLGLV